MLNYVWVSERVETFFIQLDHNKEIQPIEKRA